ncbi:MAG TPA: nucleotidyltransferase family protein [Candidatus Limnocylindrales bacterium]|nr:nucleotidyltransferase family protein [Candidatus Limnocylindrales bacterium]
MKAFILAAGNGTRLRPLTDTLPKCLLPIQGTPLLKIWLDLCKAAGIDEVLVNVHAHPSKIREFALQQNDGVRVRIAEEKELLGSAGTLAENRSFVAGEKDFFILYGDVLTNVDLAQLFAFHQGHHTLATLGIHQVPDPTQCGIVSADENNVVRSFVEKPARSESNWAFSGVMVARQEIFDSIPMQRPADVGFHLLPRLTGRMSAYKISGFLLDIGTLNNYTAAQSSWPGLG